MHLPPTTLVFFPCSDHPPIQATTMVLLSSTSTAGLKVSTFLAFTRERPFCNRLVQVLCSQLFFSQLVFILAGPS
jgi:hypothetical protein